MGTYLRVLSESYPMTTNIKGFFKNMCFLLLWMKIASALEGLSMNGLVYLLIAWT